MLALSNFIKLDHVVGTSSSALLGHQVPCVSGQQICLSPNFLCLWSMAIVLDLRSLMNRNPQSKYIRFTY
jgi:hypothetical protein